MYPFIVMGLFSVDSRNRCQMPCALRGILAQVLLKAFARSILLLCVFFFLLVSASTAVRERGSGTNTSLFLVLPIVASARFAGHRTQRPSVDRFFCEEVVR